MTVKTGIGFTTRDRIYVRGRDLADEVLGKMDFIDMIYFTATGKEPDDRTRAMTNAIIVTATDHGLTPSAIAARMTILGAPESLQGAVAAGLLGAGNHFLGTMQNAAAFTREEIGELSDEDDDLAYAARAQEVVRAFRAARRIVPGIGHPIHVDGDPRTPVLRRIAGENGFDGRHWRFMAAVETAACEEFGRLLPINAAGAVGATVSDMGLAPIWARAFALIGRSAGLLAHVMEELENPQGQKIWDMILEQDDSAELAGISTPDGADAKGEKK